MPPIPIVLPSLNLVFDLQEDLLLRFGLGKTMARPRMDDMRAGADQPALEPISPASDETIGTWAQAAAASPTSSPGAQRRSTFRWRSTSRSAAMSRSPVSYKKLDTFIYQRSTERDFTGFPNYNPDLTPGCFPTEPDCNPNIGTITTQDNGSGGKVYGVELAVSLDAGLFMPALEGFGVVLSESKTYNSLPDDENGDEIELDGFSGTVNSIEAYFERSRFLGPDQPPLPLGVYRHHAQRDTEHTEKHANRCGEPDRRADRLRVQLGSSLEGLTLLLQGNNLTNEPAITRQSSEIGGSSTGLLPWEDDNYGRVIMLGASYKF